jgi:hypothetical protein
MNIFTKLTISIMFLGITQSGFSQPTYASRQKVNIPFYNRNAVRADFLKQQTSSDTIWLPAVVNEFLNGRPSTRFIYEYHENGLLKKFSMYDLNTEEENFMGSYDFNNIYCDPLMDILDTIFTNGYVDYDTGEYHPPFRYYYNNRQADSSYWEEYYQEWDGTQWKSAQKTTYVHLLDTATVSEFQDHVEIFDGNGNITRGHKAFLTFDEQSNVREALIEEYKTSIKQYAVTAKNVYLYDDEGKCHTKEQYVPTSSDTWKLNTKLTNMKWFEFHGCDNGDVLFYGNPIDIHEDYPLKNKNKVSTLEYWGWDNGVFGLVWDDTIKWEIEPLSYNFGHYSKVGCIAQRYYKNFNEHYHITVRGELYYVGYLMVPCPDLGPAGYLIDYFTNKYDERGRRYEYIHLNTWDIPPDPDYPDTLYKGDITITYVVDSFTYVGCPVGIDELLVEKHTLLIVPNPADETVRITATDSIAAITFYASDGRLVYTQNGSGKEMIVNLRGLSQGIYLVQARLKDGGVQTGKVVVR